MGEFLAPPFCKFRHADPLPLGWGVRDVYSDEVSRADAENHRRDVVLHCQHVTTISTSHRMTSEYIH